MDLKLKWSRCWAFWVDPSLPTVILVVTVVIRKHKNLFSPVNNSDSERVCFSQGSSVRRWLCHSQWVSREGFFYSYIIQRSCLSYRTPLCLRGNILVYKEPVFTECYSNQRQSTQRGFFGHCGVIIFWFVGVLLTNSHKKKKKTTTPDDVGHECYFPAFQSIGALNGL